MICKAVKWMEKCLYSYKHFTPVPRGHWVPYNCLQLQLKAIWSPLLTYMGDYIKV